MRLWRFIGIAAAWVISSALLFSCSRPASDEVFVRTGDRNVYGQYEFALDMDDNLFRYDISVLAEFGCGKEIFEDFESMPLEIMMESPSGGRYMENVWMDRTMLVDGSFFGRTLSGLWRSGLEPVEYGRWTVCVGIPEDIISHYRLLGVGLTLKRNVYGTREAEEVQGE